jgi:ABC-type antimicrobial peptide transport system permease subunit
MRNADIIAMAFHSLLKRKMRTFLTVLGVVVGTSSIVVMISLGISMSDTFNETLSQMGDITLISVFKPNSVSGSSGKELKLDSNAVVKFQSIPGVVAATPLVETYLYAKSGRYTAGLSVLGILPEAMEALGYTPAKGRLLETGDTLHAVYGAEAPFQFYRPSTNWRYGPGDQTDFAEREPDVDVMKDKIQISPDSNFLNESSDGDGTERESKTYRIQTAGLLKKKDDYRVDNSVIMPLKQVEKMRLEQQKAEQQQMQDWGYGIYAPGQNQETGYEMAYVKCVDLNTVKRVRDQIEEMGYPAYIPSQQLESMEKVSNSLQGLFGAIGAVALFVAAIGITNTMIMSIYERTREIGVMKVIGALLSDIRKLFLLEAALIGLFGGVLGVGLSFLLSLLLNLNSASLSFINQDYMMAEPSSISTITPWLCGLALVFATGVGLISGYFPARRAMKISALAAIKSE